jgi:tripartite-type tricarboxylate transporter receptor subunit TctC
MFKMMTKTNMLMVPYKGGGPIAIDLVAGHVVSSFNTMPAIEPHIRANPVGAIAVTAEKRAGVLPDVPTVGETVPGYAIPYWTAIFAPAGTPPAIVERIAAETRKAMQDPDMAKRLGEIGVVGVGSSPQELDRFWRQQLDYLGKVVKEANVALE